MNLITSCLPQSISSIFEIIYWYNWSDYLNYLKLLILISVFPIGQEWAALEPKYWAEMQEVISTRKLRIWDALDQALPQYNDVLKERRQLIVETDNLKKQNAELRMLLQQYLSSKVNKELQIPPTRVLQSEAK